MKFFLPITLLLLQLDSLSQKISFSEPDSINPYLVRSEIIGKVQDKFFVYHHVANRNIISIYDDSMHLRGHAGLDFLPAAVNHLVFLPYPNYCLAIFQTVENNVAYCKAVKLDPGGRLVEAKIIDSAKAGIFQGGEIYAVSVSENKNYILFNRSLWGLRKNALQMDQIVMDKDLTVVKNEHYFIPFRFKEQFLSNALIDNRGNVIFICGQTRSERKTDLVFYKSPVDGSDLIVRDFPIDKYELQDITIKINNEKDIYYLVSLYRDDDRFIGGLFTMMLKSDLSDFKAPQSSAFGRREKTLANRHVAASQSYNNYVLSDIILKADGGFVVTISLNRNENSTNGDGNASRRHTEPDNYVMSQAVGQPNRLVYDYVNQGRGYSPSGGNLDPFLYIYNDFQLAGPVFETHLQPSPLKSNVMSFSFDKGNRSVAINSLNVIQRHSELSHYSVAILGNEVVFLYNKKDNDKNILCSFGLLPNGSAILNPSIEGNSEYTFFPAGAKQVTDKEVLVPCQRNFRWTVAKIRFD